MGLRNANCTTMASNNCFVVKTDFLQIAAISSFSAVNVNRYVCYFYDYIKEGIGKEDMDILLFFDQHQTILPLYEAFAGEMQVQFPDSKIKVQKTQITFSNRHVFACVSFLRVKKKAELPDDYFVLTLGLPYPLESERVAVKTEPYPGRWTTHIVISKMSDLDEELFAWVAQAYEFSEKK